MTTTEARYLANQKARQERLTKEVKLVYRGLAYTK